MSTEQTAPVDSFVAAAAAPGTIDYFVLLFSDSRRRPALSAGLALGKVIMNIARQATEAEIRYLKLHWWLEEVARTKQRHARHPLTTTLTAKLDHTGWLPPLERLIAGAQKDVGVERFESLSGLLPHCHYAAERQALLVSLDRDCSDATLASARAAGVGICLTEMLRDSDGRLPDDGFADGATDWKAQLAAIAEDHFDAMQSGAATGSVPAPVALQAALYRKMLQRELDGTAVGPLRLLWQAWRQARKLQR